MKNSVNIRRPLWMVLFIFLLLESAGAQSSRMVVQNLRSLGMGGTSVAVFGGDNPLFFNPALLALVKNGRFNFIDARFQFNQAFFDQLKFYKDNKDAIDTIEDLPEDERNALYDKALQEAQKQATSSLAGPLSIHYLRKNFGAGVFTQVNLTHELFEGASGIPLVHINAQGNAQVMLGYSRAIKGILPHAIAIGVTGKYLHRVQTEKFKTLSGLRPDETFEIYEADVFSLDVGLMYPITRRLHFGVSFYDVLSPNLAWSVNLTDPISQPPPGQIKATMRMGLAYYPKLRVGHIFRDLVLALDINQPFSSDITFFKKLYFGAEGRLTEVFMVRGGFYQGYPSFGLGLDFRILRLDFAFFGEELGKYAGDFVSWNRVLSLQLGF